MNYVSPFKLFCLIVLFLPSSVLHICGFFSPYWVNEKSSFECFSGVLYTVNCPDNIVSLWHILKYVYQQNMIKIKTFLQWNLTSKRIFEGLSDGVLGLQSISMIFIIISTINTVYSFGCTKEDDNEEISCYEHCTVFISCLYPFSGNQ